jgi:hypothetical protein
VIQEQIKELQAKILEVGGVKLRAMQSKVANTKGLIDLAGENIVKAEVAQAKAQRDAEKLEKTINSILSLLYFADDGLQIGLTRCQIGFHYLKLGFQLFQKRCIVHDGPSSAKYRRLKMEWKTFTRHLLKPNKS